MTVEPKTSRLAPTLRSTITSRYAQNIGIYIEFEGKFHSTLLENYFTNFSFPKSSNSGFFGGVGSFVWRHASWTVIPATWLPGRFEEAEESTSDFFVVHGDQRGMFC